MTNSHSASLVAAIVAASLIVASPSIVARVDVRVEFDKAFDFRAVHAWDWHPEGAGDVKMARTRDDDPDAMKRTAEPWILDAVGKEMARLKLVRAFPPDLTIRYYLLLSTNISAQTMGQFLPAVPQWGLPPFPPATQSFQVMHRGSLVLDLSANDTVVWRGLAQANIRTDIDNQKRESLLREAVRDLLRRYPVRR